MCHKQQAMELTRSVSKDNVAKEYLKAITVANPLTDKELDLLAAFINEIIKLKSRIPDHAIACELVTTGDRKRDIQASLNIKPSSYTNRIKTLLEKKVVTKAEHGLLIPELLIPDISGESVSLTFTFKINEGSTTN